MPNTVFMINFQDAEKTADGDFIMNMSYPENEWLFTAICVVWEYGDCEPTYIRDIIKTKNRENDKQLFII